MTGVSVALPVRRVGPHFDAAVASILRQTLRGLDVLIVLNGADGAARDAAGAAARRDRRVRVLELDAPGLAGALNAALREARHDLVARMDADDLCRPERLERQSAWMGAHPSVIGLGTAYERLSDDGRPLGVVRPPTSPADIRWRLLLGNTFCHGSMMLRRSAVLAAGGYDESCARGQDYELWMRLAPSHDLANLTDILYTHRVRPGAESPRPDPVQAAAEARLKLGAWRGLESDEGRGLQRALADALHAADGPGEAIKDLEARLRAGATPEGLLAWLGAKLEHAERLVDACRPSRLREATARLAALGVRGLHLWGAGEHTRRVLDEAPRLPVRILGVVDDAADGRLGVGGLVATPPDRLRPGEHVLISSDLHEAAIWRSSAPVRARGVHVWRLYETGPRDGAIGAAAA